MGTPTDDRRTTTLGFPPGAALLFHTDGLVGEIIDTGFLRLSSATRPGTAATMCDHIMATVANDHPPTTSL